MIDNITQQQNAFLTAQSGLDEFLSNRGGLGFSGIPGVTETITLNIRDGTAEVVLERLRPQLGGDPALYIIRSTGLIPGPRAQDPDARRTVAQLAEWQSGTMTAKAGWMSLTGLHKNGNSGTISGEDRCAVVPDVPGVSVPEDPGFTTSGNFEPDGTPPLEEYDDMQDLVDELGINWPGIADQSALTPDVVIPGGSWPSFSDPDYWPVIHVTGDYNLTSTGRGILIVTGGGLTINGNTTWEGIVLVGEHLDLQRERKGLRRHLYWTRRDARRRPGAVGSGPRAEFRGEWEQEIPIRFVHGCGGHGVVRRAQRDGQRMDGQLARLLTLKGSCADAPAETGSG